MGRGLHSHARILFAPRSAKGTLFATAQAFALSRETMPRFSRRLAIEPPSGMRPAHYLTSAEQGMNFSVQTVSDRTSRLPAALHFSKHGEPSGLLHSVHFVKQRKQLAGVLP